MNRKLIAVATCLTMVVLCWPHSANARKEEQGKVSKIMQEKLKNSQKMLEGIALADYDKITRSAEELIQLTKAEEWRVLKTPRYEMHSDDFVRATETIIQKAKMKNLDGVTLAYFELTMACVRCHRYVREVRDASLPSDRAVAMR
jgi:cytochrome c556